MIIKFNSTSATGSITVDGVRITNDGVKLSAAGLKLVQSQRAKLLEYVKADALKQKKVVLDAKSLEQNSVSTSKGRITDILIATDEEGSSHVICNVSVSYTMKPKIQKSTDLLVANKVHNLHYMFVKGGSPVLIGSGAKLRLGSSLTTVGQKYKVTNKFENAINLDGTPVAEPKFVKPIPKTSGKPESKYNKGDIVVVKINDNEFFTATVARINARSISVVYTVDQSREVLSENDIVGLGTESKIKLNKVTMKRYLKV
jgi:hypothetical protein